MTTFEKARAAVQLPPISFAARRSGGDMLALMARAAALQAFARANGMGIEQAQAIIARKHRRYGDELTRLVCRAATSPASTIEPEWATELVVAQGAELIAALMPRSAFAQLAALGMHMTFGEGEILVPDFIPSAPGVFVRQGDPIPVIQGQTTGQILTRKKMACIVGYTGELAEGAIVTMEELFRARIAESTSVAIDGVLLDNLPADDARPAGLLNGAVVVASSTSMQRDLQTLADGLFAAANHVVRVPVLIMNTAQAFAARLQLNREFIPVVVSSSMPPGTVAMLDASDFAAAGGQIPRFEISKEAALHFEDSAPQHINPGTMASPVKSLWQEELLGLRLILEVDWLLRRPGVVSSITGVSWKLGGD